MFNIFNSNINKDDYFVVDYFLESKTNLRDAVWNLAVGQSVGNPNLRNEWETDELFENHSCFVLHAENELKNKTKGLVSVAFACKNINFYEDGISHLLVNVMGGQLDIDLILKCSVLDIRFPKSIQNIFLGPKFGISGIREFTQTYRQPILGAIVKPKTGISAFDLLEMVKQLVDGGVNFIKEDEILSNPHFCRIQDRIPLIANYLHDKKVIYCASIHADAPFVIDRVKQVHDLGGNGVHVNFWCGLGIYKSIRELDLPIFVHFQKSGDKIFTNKNHDFYIDWKVIVKLAGMMGVDFIHAGMIGGYYKWDEKETMEAVKIANSFNVMPALSCGFQPGLTKMVTEKIGIDYMANVGGAIHGHPDGTLSGAKAMKQSITGKYDKEFYQALEKWGSDES